MNDQFIQGVLFDWNKIDDDSYLKKIEAFHGIEKLEFKNPITFFVGENGSGKSTLRTDSIRKAVQKIMYFLRMIPIRNCALLSGLQEGIAKKNGDIFCGQKAFTMLRHRKRSMQIFVILPQSIMRNPMGRASWHLHRTIFEQMDCISLMSRRRHCLHSGSLHC